MYQSTPPADKENIMQTGFTNQNDESSRDGAQEYGSGVTSPPPAARPHPTPIFRDGVRKNKKITQPPVSETTEVTLSFAHAEPVRNETKVGTDHEFKTPDHYEFRATALLALRIFSHIVLRRFHYF